MGSASCRGARPRTRSSPGYSGTTAPGCTPRWRTSARCGSSKTGMRLRPSKPIPDSAMGYGFQGQGHISTHAPYHRVDIDARGTPALVVLGVLMALVLCERQTVVIRL